MDCVNIGALDENQTVLNVQTNLMQKTGHDLEFCSNSRNYRLFCNYPIFVYRSYISKTNEIGNKIETVKFRIFLVYNLYSFQVEPRVTVLRFI